jgi:hypothetical protein
MKSLLLTAVMSGVSEMPIRAALSIARAFDSKIFIKLYQPRTDDHVVDPMSWGLTSFASQEGLLEEETTRARLVIENRIRDMGLGDDLSRIVMDDQPLTTWRELGRASRVHDMSVVSREAFAENAAGAMEQLLFDSGRPMLLSPANWDRPVGEIVAIAWNRSTETARLVSQTIGLLRRAREVRVIEIEDWSVDGPNGKDLCDYLTINDVPARLHAVGKARGDYGYRILHEAGAFSADLLLKGAYTQSRITQVMFGGATRDILHQARLPVLFAH